MSDKIIEYFAASNSYSGFVSYFDSVFNPTDYEQIYILKGGPGTGKSTFMKDIIKNFQSDAISRELIFCSSDPDSLDGIILESSGKKIAVLDGTAPHAFDPMLPGAAEKIINLGMSWNPALLKNNREKINNLAIKKRKHYKSAYHFLSIAGKCVEIIDEEISSLLEFPYDILEKHISEIPIGNSKEKTKVISAFCKSGFLNANSGARNADNTVNIVGIYGSEYIITRFLLNEARKKKADIIISPSPLDTKKTEAIYFTKTDTLIVAGDKPTNDKATLIDTSRFINVKALSSVKEKLEMLYKEREVMLWCATDEFKKASEAHFETEKIYTAAMDFKKHKKLFNEVLSEIEDIFGINNDK